MVPMMGWGNAMRYLLTGDEFDAKEAYRVGLVQEVTPAGQDLDRAIAIAETIAAQAPLAVRATLASLVTSYCKTSQCSVSTPAPLPSRR